MGYQETFEIANLLEAAYTGCSIKTRFALKLLGLRLGREDRQISSHVSKCCFFVGGPIVNYSEMSISWRACSIVA